jgi:ABC-type transporter Mla MlaB component
MNQSTPIANLLSPPTKSNQENFDQLNIRENLEGDTKDIKEVITKNEQITDVGNKVDNKISINLPFIEDIDTKTIKFGIILLIVLTMTQNKQGQNIIIENLPDGLKSTELITNVSVSVVSIFIIFLFYKLLN